MEGTSLPLLLVVGGHIGKFFPISSTSTGYRTLENNFAPNNDKKIVKGCLSGNINTKLSVDDIGTQ